jgi:hypothetical protein
MPQWLRHANSAFKTLIPADGPALTDLQRHFGLPVCPTPLRSTAPTEARCRHGLETGSDGAGSDRAPESPETADGRRRLPDQNRVLIRLDAIGAQPFANSQTKMASD